MTSTFNRPSRSSIDMEIRLRLQRSGVEAQCTLRPKFDPSIEHLITKIVNDLDALWAQAEELHRAFQIK